MLNRHSSYSRRYRRSRLARVVRYAVAASVALVVASGIAVSIVAPAAGERQPGTATSASEVSFSAPATPQVADAAGVAPDPGKDPAVRETGTATETGSLTPYVMGAGLLALLGAIIIVIWSGSTQRHDER